MAKKQNAPGRPTGSTNQEYDTVVVQPPACKKCGSTNRTPYTSRREFSYAGEIDGRPYNLIVWRRCRCADCGQHRTEKTYEQNKCVK